MSGQSLDGHQINPEDLRRVLGESQSYEPLMSAFKIAPRDEDNMATETVDRHANSGRGDAIALVCAHEGVPVERYSYAQLSDLSNRFAVFLRTQGVRRGDVVACYCGQGLQTAMAHLGAYKLGAIVAPLSPMYGPDALAHVLSDCRAKVLVTQREVWDRVEDVQAKLNRSCVIIVAGQCKAGEVSFEAALETDATGFVPVCTSTEDPALLLYSSGSTGMPKGVLHRQRLLRGYLASVSLFYELEMNEPDCVLWTVSDWSWVAGIFNVMLTGWFFGQTVLAGSARFSADWAFDFMAEHGVTHCFLTPTALKRMAAYGDPRAEWPNLTIRAIGTGGEPLPGAVLDWAEERLNAPINEFYGLTEVNHLIGNCRRLWPIKPGSMGRPYPGHTVVVLDKNGKPVPDGELGEIAVADDDPTLCIGYWQQPERTKAMRIGKWIRTGDFAYKDEDGYFWFKGRNDDLIKSAGYRIGPAEIEDALVRHPSVAEAAVIGVPDEERGQIVKAFVRLNGTEPASDQLADALQNFVRTNLAVFKCPKLIDFVDGYPLTSTGKINRKALREGELPMA